MEGKWFRSQSRKIVALMQENDKYKEHMTTGSENLTCYLSETCWQITAMGWLAFGAYSFIVLTDGLFEYIRPVVESLVDQCFRYIY